MNAKIVCVLLVTAAAAAAQGDAAKPEEAPKGEPVAVRTGALEYRVERPGTLVPADREDVSLWLDAFHGPFVVLEAVEHGTPVGAGDVLVRIETTAIDEQIEQAEFDLRQAEEEARRAETEARHQEQAEEEQLRRMAKEEEWGERRFRGWLEQERAFERERERLQTQSQRDGLDDQKDELTQLERMYGEDELVDATEEIVLKRSRRGFARQTAWAELNERSREHQNEVHRAIAEEERTLNQELAPASFERRRAGVTLARARRAAAAERTRRDLEKKKERLGRLKADREKLVVRAPRAGVLLHGEHDAAPGTSRLDRGRVVAHRSVFLCVAAPDRLTVVTDVPEKELFNLRTGTACEVRPVADPDLAMTGSLRVSLMPTSGGNENAYKATIDLGKTDPRLRPGMKCTVSGLVKTPASSLVVPKKAVAARDGRSEVKAAPTAAGPFEARVVKTGASNDDEIVIKEGLEAGWYVLVEGGEGK